VDDGTLSWSPSGDGPFRTAGALRPPTVGDLLGGRFLLKEVLGTGGSGIVFAALDTENGQEVAVKVLHPHLVGSRGVERLRREIRAARGFHPHTVALFDLHSENGLHFLSMELVQGRTLKELIAENGTLDPDETARIGGQLAAALASFHVAGILHRDVKPANVLITADGDVKLCDMGLVRPVESGLTVTETAMVVGTPAFMAPEQATGQELTSAVDVYALGLTLYTMLTGEPPLQDGTALSTLMRRQREHAPPVRRSRRECPRWLGRLVARMLEPSPADRPSAKRVQRALESRAYGFWLRRRFMAAAVALLVLSVGTPLAYSWLRRGATVRVVTDARGVHGVDAKDRTTWSFDLGVPVGKVFQADLNGDGRPETIIASKLEDRSRRNDGPIEPSRVAVLSSRGRILTDVTVQDLIEHWHYPYREELRVMPRVMDLDGDGVREVVVTYQQRRFYPSGILVYWPRWKTWDEVLAHSGYIDDVAPLPGNGPGLRFAGVNNRFCMFRVVGEMGLVPPSSPDTRGDRSTLVSPDQGMGDSVRATWHWYTLLAGPVGGALAWKGVHLTAGPHHEALLRMANGRTQQVDRFGNPLGSPNWGRDLSGLRRRFFASLQYLKVETRGVSSSAVEDLVHRTRSSVAPLLEEAPYRVVLVLKAGRALARSGDSDGAIDLLRTTLRKTPNEDVIYRLAQIEAVAGQLREAKAEIAPVLATPHTSRGTYDIPQLGIRLGIELRDRHEVSACVERLLDIHSRGMSSSGLAAALVGRAHLWWDEVGPADLAVGSYSYEPAGEAIACLCRWRVGKATPGDIGAMKTFVRDNPDARAEGRLALAAAELAAGRPEKAQAVLDNEINVLEMISKDDSFNHQLLDLARAMRCKALLAGGHRRAAREAARRLEPELTPGLLPAHLVREVLRATG